MRRYLYLAPAGVLLLGLVGVPLALSVALGVGHYGAALHDPLLRQAGATTLLFAVVSVALELGLGLASALLLHQSLHLRGLWRAIALLPWILPSAVMAISWRWMFNADRSGIVNDLLMRLDLIHGPIAWLGAPGPAFATLVLADVWKTTPFVTLILLAGLQAIPADLYEALSVDGAGPFRRFRLLTLPQLRPAIFLALVFRLIQAIGIFDLVWVMTGGGPANSTLTVAVYIYNTVFRYVQPAYGAALTGIVAVTMFVLAVALGALARGRQPA